MSKTKLHRKPQPASPVTTSPQKSRLHLLVYLGLLLSTLAAYSQVGSFNFVSFDDIWYVTENPRVQAGLTPANIAWAFTSTVDANWIPVTMLSHMAACSLFGLDPGAHHWINVIFHALAAMLLFAALHRATHALWPSAFVAFLFALHPLHVESVAWVSERKDVLSAFFWFLALYAYVRYIEKPAPSRYLLVLAPFSLGLLSKPMLVTFPFTLLLLDLWPFRRAFSLRLLWEKIPFLALALVSSGVTYFVQRTTGAVQVTRAASDSILNALISYVSYIGQMFWPVNLAVFYPYRPSIPLWQAAAAFLLLAAISALAIFAWRTRPYIATGWFWYLGTLVPVIGFVQVGGQSHADRYMYIPMVGLSIVLAWGMLDIVAQWPRTRYAIASIAVASCLAFFAVTVAQAAYWRGNESLYSHALAVTHDNFPAEFNLGQYLKDVPGRGEEAARHVRAALRLNPNSIDAHNVLGDYLIATGHIPEAIAQFQDSLRLNPNSVDTRNRVAGYLMSIGRTGEGIAQFEAVLRAKPDNAEAHFNLAVIYSKNPGRIPEAIAHYEAALRSKPLLARAHRNLAQLLLAQNRTAEAQSHIAAAERIEALH